MEIWEKGCRAFGGESNKSFTHIPASCLWLCEVIFVLGRADFDYFVLFCFEITASCRCSTTRWFSPTLVVALWSTRIRLAACVHGWLRFAALWWMLDDMLARGPFVFFSSRRNALQTNVYELRTRTYKKEIKPPNTKTGEKIGGGEQTKKNPTTNKTEQKALKKKVRTKLETDSKKSGKQERNRNNEPSCGGRRRLHDYLIICRGRSGPRARPWKSCVTRKQANVSRSISTHDAGRMWFSFECIPSIVLPAGDCFFFIDLTYRYRLSNYRDLFVEISKFFDTAISFFMERYIENLTFDTIPKPYYSPCSVVPFGVPPSCLSLPFSLFPPPRLYFEERKKNTAFRLKTKKRLGLVFFSPFSAISVFYSFPPCFSFTFFVFPYVFCLYYGGP